MDTLPSAQPGAAPLPVAVAAAPQADAGGARRTGASLNVLALLLALLALAIAVLVLVQSGATDRRLEESGADRRVDEERANALERRMGELERQWAQAQSDAELAGGALGDADMRRRREQIALIDVERLVEQAQMELRLGVAPESVIDALAAADSRLGRASGPGAQHVQAALRRDMARLRAAPNLDRGALAARIDPLLAQVDSWHMSADPSHGAAAPSPGPAPAPAPASKAPNAADSWGARARAWINREFGDLVRIREVETPQALMIGPAQQQLARDRVRLDMLDLRQAILARDERTIRAELDALVATLDSYFDPNQPELAAALAQLRATAAAALTDPALTLEDTLAALRAARAPEPPDAHPTP